MTRFVSVATAVLDAPREVAFDVIVPIDLIRIMTGTRLVPAVVAVSGQTGDWDAAGQRRSVHLSDGSVLQERLTALDRPHRFAYDIGGFTGVLGRLVSAARGEWDFLDTGTSATVIAWRYAFVATSPLLAPLLWLFVRLAWVGYMRRVLQAAVTIVEASVRQAGRPDEANRQAAD